MVRLGQAPMKKLHSLLLLSGFVFLACLIWKTGVRQLWNELGLLGWGLVPFIALEFVAEGIHALGWGRCLSVPHGRLPWSQHFRIRMAGNAINYLTPTASLGGEVAKAAWLSSSSQEGPEAISGVLVGRLCAGVGHLLFVVAGSLFVLRSVTLPRGLWAAMLLSGGLVAAGILAFLLLQKHGKLGALVRWLAAHKLAGERLRTFGREVDKVDETLKTFYRERPRDLALAVCWHLVGHSVGIFQTWWFFSLMRQPVSAGAAAGVWILGMWFDLLTFAVPLNLGTLEGSRMIAFKATGHGAVLGMTYGVALRLAQLACACFGLLSYVSLFTAWRTPLSSARPAIVHPPSSTGHPPSSQPLQSR
jgi:hypothetical protein